MFVLSLTLPTSISFFCGYTYNIVFSHSKITFTYQIAFFLGYDKLKPYGFPIHAGIDGYSRKVLWLEVARTNNDPEVTASFFLECVRQNKCCPLQTRTDYGTENGTIAAMQCYFRADDDAPFSGEHAHLYGTSTRNQRIENFWSHFKKSCSSWWIQFFKDLIDSGQIDIANELQKECLWFCFNGVIQEALDEMSLYWNTHNIRSSRHETVGGIPDILFHLPEQTGAFDCSVPVSKERLCEMKNKCASNEEDVDNIFQEYFHYVIDNEGLSYPSNYEEALNLCHYLLNVSKVFET